MRGYARKQRLVARILLMVFVPMLLLSSLHLHRSEPETEAACYACTHHIKHADHLSAAPRVDGQCVLCQWLMLTYDVVRSTVVMVCLPVVVVRSVLGPQRPQTVMPGCVSLRGPPSRFD